MARKKRKKQQLLLPKPQKTLPMHWPGNQPPPSTSQQPQPQSPPSIGPLPPKNYKEQNCLPQSWPEKYEKLHKLLRNKSPEELKKTLEKFLHIKKNGYKDAPQDITDAHIEVAEYILKNNYSQKT